MTPPPWFKARAALPPTLYRYGDSNTVDRFFHQEMLRIPTTQKWRDYELKTLTSPQGPWSNSPPTDPGIGDRLDAAYELMQSDELWHLMTPTEKARTKQRLGNAADPDSRPGLFMNRNVYSYEPWMYGWCVSTSYSNTAMLACSRSYNACFEIMHPIEFFLALAAAGYSQLKVRGAVAVGPCIYDAPVGRRPDAPFGEDWESAPAFHKRPEFAPQQEWRLIWEQEVSVLHQDIYAPGLKRFCRRLPVPPV